MSLVDVVLIVVTLAFALSGFRQGLLVSATSILGFLAGALIGAQLSGPVASRINGSSVTRVFAALVVVLAAALLGQILAGAAGRALRRRVTWEPAKMVDAVGGAAVSAASVLLVAWMVASPLASSPFPAVASQVRKSALVQAVDNVVPDSVRAVYETLKKAIDRRGLPDVLDPLTPTQVRNVAPPDKGAVSTKIADSVKGSVVKITGIAPSCSRQIDGSGFVYAPQRVMTNAHVLAGVGHPKVYAEGRVYPAHPVYIDEETDVAVLDVPGLPEVPLAFAAQTAVTGTSTIIMGYPGGGPLYIGPARVRERSPISGPDFRNQHNVVREVYALYGTVRAGNSGGPLLSTDGKVLGVVFASSVDDPTTGYALTSQLVKRAATAGSTATAAVGTGPCE